MSKNEKLISAHVHNGIVKWQVSKRQSKAGDNNEIEKLKRKVKKLKEVLADAQAIIKDPEPPSIELLIRIDRALHL